jgi:hypothetical protein
MAGRKPGTPKTGGRVKGTPNRITADVKAMVLGALNAVGGQKYLEEQAHENPVAFMSLLGKVLPLTIGGDPDNPVRIERIERAIVEPPKR